MTRRNFPEIILSYDQIYVDVSTRSNAIKALGIFPYQVQKKTIAVLPLENLQNNLFELGASLFLVPSNLSWCLQNGSHHYSPPIGHPNTICCHHRILDKTYKHRPPALLYSLYIEWHNGRASPRSC